MATHVDPDYVGFEHLMQMGMEQHHQRTHAQPQPAYYAQQQQQRHPHYAPQPPPPHTHAQPQYADDQYADDQYGGGYKGNNDDDDPNRCQMRPAGRQPQQQQRRTSDFGSAMRPQHRNAAYQQEEPAYEQPPSHGRKRAPAAYGGGGGDGPVLDDNDAGYVDTSNDRFDPGGVVLKKIRPPDTDPALVKDMFLNLETRNSNTPIQVRAPTQVNDRGEEARFVISYAVHDAARVLLEAVRSRDIRLERSAQVALQSIVNCDHEFVGVDPLVKVTDTLNTDTSSVYLAEVVPVSVVLLARQWNLTYQHELLPEVLSGVKKYADARVEPYYGDDVSRFPSLGLQDAVNDAMRSRSRDAKDHAQKELLARRYMYTVGVVGTDAASDYAFLDQHAPQLGRALNDQRVAEERGNMGHIDNTAAARAKETSAQ